MLFSTYWIECISQPGIEPVPPALEGGILTIEPPGKPLTGKYLKKRKIGLLTWEEKNYSEFWPMQQSSWFFYYISKQTVLIFNSCFKYTWVLMCLFNVTHLPFRTSSTLFIIIARHCISPTIYYVDINVFSLFFFSLFLYKLDNQNYFIFK